ncbi:uncharacterized protein N7459_003690 [Penicillium hispanicum]|uniref:uncharacterized protein n=1 Tax=Penicillium hispanicum TaxID=1080232 RepID=UPI002540F76E|nr:uncharacterized protein N7459_003690 [Penicillium hispanicum]KAJ5587925.1 hypothetical protein N7459_003690 [Penicillium hispanicum]
MIQQPNNVTCHHHPSIFLQVNFLLGWWSLQSDVTGTAFMSSFVSSLLAEFGSIHTSRHPPSQNEAESPIGQTKPTRNSQTEPPLALDVKKDPGRTDLAGGDAVSLPSPHFFTNLPKDMSGRDSEPESTRLVPLNGPVSSRTSNGNLPETILEDDTHIVSVDCQDSGTERPASMIQPNGSSDVTFGLRHDTSETTGRHRGHSFNIDELGQASLPADDGMGWLRNKIHAIRDLACSNDEKARMIHDLMTASYNSSRSSLPNGSAAMSPQLSPLSVGIPTSPSGPEVKQALDTSAMSPTLTASTSQHETLFSLKREDLQPTYASRVEPESPVADAGDEDPDIEELEEAFLGCQHYMRNVKLQCFTCKKWYTCRFCHDVVEDHHLIRRDTEHMLCMLCGHPQPAAQNCRQCGQQSAQYYCEICKLWDNDSKKSIYHCADCGICRIGQGLGKDFFHCKTCSVCLPISIEDTHRCIERSTQCDCPICGDYMFTSPETVVVMRCGHSIHHKCLSEYSKTSFRCPICSKTITNMESTFRNLDRTIESQPMPADFKDTKGLIYCNDCGAKSIVKYHWLGLKCDLCESYNTAQIRLLQGDVSVMLDEEGVGELPSRPRSSSLNRNEDSTTSLAALHLDTSLTSHSHLSVPMATQSDRRFVSYNMTHGRAISPVVSNYFGLPPERESEKHSSMPFFGNLSRADGETEYGALNFLSRKLRDRYGFLAGETTAEGASDAEEENDAESSDSVGSDGEGDGDDDEEEDEVEYIDIFGHR